MPSETHHFGLSGKRHQEELSNAGFASYCLYCCLCSGALKLSPLYFGVCPVYIIFPWMVFVVSDRGIVFQSSVS